MSRLWEAEADDSDRPADVDGFECPMRPTPPLPTAQEFQLVVKLIEAIDVPVMDSTGSDVDMELSFDGYYNSEQ